MTVAMEKAEPFERKAFPVWQQWIALPAIFGLLYFSGAKIGIELSRQADNVAAFWPPNALIIALLLVGPSLRRVPILIGCCVANVLTNYWHGDAIWVASGLTAANLIEISVVLLAAHRLKPNLPFSLNWQNAPRFLLSAMIAVVCGALIGATIVNLAYGAPWIKVAATWAAADLAGLVIFVPPILCLAAHSASKRKKTILSRSGFEIGALVAAFLLIFYVVFVSQDYPSPYLFVPIMLWLATRFGLAPTAIGCSGLSIFLVLMTFTGHFSPWLASHTSLTSQIADLQIFIAIFCISFLPIALLIDEFQNLTARLRVSEDRYALAVQGASVGLWDWDVKTNALYWSPRFKEIVGVTDENFVPHLDEFVGRLHDDDRDAVLDALNRHVHRGEPYKIEYRLRHESGCYVWIHARGQAIWDEYGTPLRMAGSVDDISEAKRNAQHLVESEQKFRSAYHHSPIGMALVAPNGQFIDVNKSLCSILGYEEKALLSLDFQTLTHPDDLDTDLSNVHQMLTGEIDSYQMEKRYFHKDGHIVWIHLSVSLVKRRDGSPKYFIAQISDITSRKNAEQVRDELIESLNVSNKELESFAYVASHDLKAPLRVIANVSSWLEEDLEDKLNDQDRKHLDLLHNRVRRMERLLDDLLEYSRVGRAMDTRYSEQISGGELIADILALLEPPPSFKIEIPAEFSEIQVSRMPLQQVLFNLISNAIKHHDREAGNIALQVETSGTRYRFTVMDDGPGIPEEYHEEIFRMFRKLESRDEVEGSGMGLALVKKTIEFHGGRIVVQSGEGRGTSFSFTWPVSVEKDEQQEEAA